MMNYGTTTEWRKTTKRAETYTSSNAQREMSAPLPKKFCFDGGAWHLRATRRDVEFVVVFAFCPHSVTARRYDA